jgi:hypothetical protein
MDAYRRVKVQNGDIRRRPTQTFSSADLAEENRLALRATEKNYPTGFTGWCRISFSSGKR